MQTSFLVNSPIDEGRLSGGVVPDEHDGHLLPRCQQLQFQVVGDLDQPLVRVGVHSVALLEDPLVDGGGGGVDGRVGRGALLHATRHLQSVQHCFENRDERELEKTMDVGDAYIAFIA